MVGLGGVGGGRGEREGGGGVFEADVGSRWGDDWGC